MSTFFCLVGPPKTGTTWLSEYFRNHPNVYAPPIKELQLFSRRYRPDLYSWMDPLFKRNISKLSDKLSSKSIKTTDADIELFRLTADILSLPSLYSDADFRLEYRNLFRNRLKDDISAFGEFSTTYCTLPPEGFKLLHSCFESTRFIIVLRNPADRMWSHIKHKARYFNSDPIDDLERWSNDAELLESSNYSKIINNLSSVVPKAHIHICIFENLFGPDDTELYKLTEFLEVKYIQPERQKIIYGSEGLKATPHFSDYFNTLAIKNGFLSNDLLSEYSSLWQ